MQWPSSKNQPFLCTYRLSAHTLLSQSVSVSVTVPQHRRHYIPNNWNSTKDMHRLVVMVQWALTILLLTDTFIKESFPDKGSYMLPNIGKIVC